MNIMAFVLFFAGALQSNLFRSRSDVTGTDATDGSAIRRIWGLNARLI